MQEKAKEPEIRFAGFTGAWEQRKFGEMANRRSEVSASGNLPRVEYEDIVSGTGTLNKDVFEKQSQKQGIVFHSGDVLYGKLRPYLQNWLLASFNGLAVGDFWVLEPQGLNSNYLYRIIQTKQFDEIANQSVGTKMPRADWKLVSKATFLNPASFNEQRLIGKFFKDIDSLLTLHQRKYEKLLNIKKSMLEKMFPKEGEVVPEIRFKGFTGAWEQRKLSDLCSMHARIGWQNLRTSEFLDQGQYLLITGTDFGNGSIRFNSCHFVKKERYDQDKNIQVKNGSILITKDGTLGKVAYVENLNKPATLNAGVFNVKTKGNDVDNKYLFQYLKAPFLMKYVDEKSTGGTIKHLNQSILVNFPVVLPGVEEQRKIGEFLSHIDSILTLHQRKLEMLKNVKQAFLEKMFV